jgi:hypothetical protein
MKHASANTLAFLAPLLETLRTLPELVERSPGCFYFKSKAYLHFHEDPTGFFADVKLDQVEFVRLPVTTPVEQGRLVELVAQSLGHP